jgi:hypothetical protein
MEACIHLQLEPASQTVKGDSDESLLPPYARSSRDLLAPQTSEAIPSSKTTMGEVLRTHVDETRADGEQTSQKSHGRSFRASSLPHVISILTPEQIELAKVGAKLARLRGGSRRRSMETGIGLSGKWARTFIEDCSNARPAHRRCVQRTRPCVADDADCVRMSHASGAHQQCCGVVFVFFAVDVGLLIFCRAVCLFTDGPRVPSTSLPIPSRYLQGTKLSTLSAQTFVQSQRRPRCSAEPSRPSPALCSSLGFGRVTPLTLSWP